MYKVTLTFIKFENENYLTKFNYSEDAPPADVLPKGIKSVRKITFSHIKSLKDIYIPKKFTSIKNMKIYLSVSS